MKEVTIVAYCDSEHDLRVAAVAERTISIDGSKPVVLDLCEPCDRIVVNLLTTMDRGVEVPKKPKKDKVRETDDNVAEVKPSQYDDAESKCPLCDHVSPRRTALGQHLRAVHNKGFRDLRKEGVQVA